MRSEQVVDRVQHGDHKCRAACTSHPRSKRTKEKTVSVNRGVQQGKKKVEAMRGTCKPNPGGHHAKWGSHIVRGKVSRATCEIKNKLD